MSSDAERHQQWASGGAGEPPNQAPKGALGAPLTRRAAREAGKLPHPDSGAGSMPWANGHPREQEHPNVADSHSDLGRQHWASEPAQPRNHKGLGAAGVPFAAFIPAGAPQDALPAVGGGADNTTNLQYSAELTAVPGAQAEGVAPTGDGPTESRSKRRDRLRREAAAQDVGLAAEELVMGPESALGLSQPEDSGNIQAGRHRGPTGEAPEEYPPSVRDHFGSVPVQPLEPSTRSTQGSPLPGARDNGISEHDQSGDHHNNRHPDFSQQYPDQHHNEPVGHGEPHVGVSAGESQGGQMGESQFGYGSAPGGADNTPDAESAAAQQAAQQHMPSPGVPGQTRPPEGARHRAAPGHVGQGNPGQDSHQGNPGQGSFGGSLGGGEQLAAGSTHSASGPSAGIGPGYDNHQHSPTPQGSVNQHRALEHPDHQQFRYQSGPQGQPGGHGALGVPGQHQGVSGQAPPGQAHSPGAHGLGGNPNGGYSHDGGPLAGGPGGAGPGGAGPTGSQGGFGSAGVGPGQVAAPGVSHVSGAVPGHAGPVPVAGPGQPVQEVRAHQPGQLDRGAHRGGVDNRGAAGSFQAHSVGDTTIAPPKEPAKLPAVDRYEAGQGASVVGPPVRQGPPSSGGVLAGPGGPLGSVGAMTGPAGVGPGLVGPEPGLGAASSEGMRGGRNAGPRLDMHALMSSVVSLGASDLHLTVGVPPMVRVRGELVPVQGHEVIGADSIGSAAFGMMTQKQREVFEEEWELDYSYNLPGVGRFRVNVYRQQEKLGMVLRLIPYEIKSVADLGLPDSVADFASYQRGLVLVTGTTGSGKSTTLAAVIDEANSTRSDHILTIEDPVEFLHDHKQCVVNQRQVGDDTKSFARALRQALRQDPDVILVGEIRDMETTSVALTAAETGHLVLGTLHTQDAVQTIDRVIDVYPPEQQHQVRTMLAGALQAVMCQTLVVTADGRGRVPVYEIMIATPGIRNLIREGKTHQVYTAMQAGKQHGMMTMDQCLAMRVREGLVSHERALEVCHNVEEFKRLVARG